MVRRLAVSRVEGMARSLLTMLVLPSMFVVACDRSPEAERSSEENRRKEQEPGLIASWFGPKSMAVVVPAGTTFTVALDHALSTDDNTAGDPVSARVVGAIMQDGRVVVPDGARARGVVSALSGSGRMKGRASMALRITSLESVDGEKDVVGRMAAGTLVAPGTKKRDAATIGGGAAAGAVIGQIIGDRPGLGAIIGGAAGTGVVLGTKGKELTLPAGTRVKFKLEGPLEATVPIKVAQAD